MMNKEPIVEVIIRYEDFKSLSEKQRKNILNIDSEQVEFLISIKNEIYEKLSAEEKKNLEGFNRTEMEPLRQEITATKMLFKLRPDVKIDISVKESYKEKHLKRSRPYAPRKIINYNFNSHKKGGR